MAHFAQLDENNVVVTVVVIDNENCLDENGNESEATGIAYCQSLFGGRWIQTSYNGNFRYNYASVGGTYDEENNAFVSPMPPSPPSELETRQWVLNQETFKWELVNNN